MHVSQTFGMEVFADPQADQAAVASEPSISKMIPLTPSRMRLLRMLPTRKSDYQTGKRVAWEWNFERVFGASWYRDPDTHEVKKAWDSSAEFVGRHLDDIL